MSGNEFDGGESRYVCGVGFDVVMWRDQVYSGEDRVVICLYVFFPLAPRGEYSVETRQCGAVCHFVECLRNMFGRVGRFTPEGRGGIQLRPTNAPTLCLVGMNMGSVRGDTPWVSFVDLGCVSSSVSLVHHTGVPEWFRFLIVRTRVPVASAMSPTHVRLCAHRFAGMGSECFAQGDVRGSVWGGRHV